MIKPEVAKKIVKNVARPSGIWCYRPVFRGLIRLLKNQSDSNVRDAIFNRLEEVGIMSFDMGGNYVIDNPVSGDFYNPRVRSFKTGKKMDLYFVLERDCELYMKLAKIRGEANKIGEYKIPDIRDVSAWRVINMKAKYGGGVMGMDKIIIDSLVRKRVLTFQEAGNYGVAINEDSSFEGRHVGYSRQREGIGRIESRRLYFKDLEDARSFRKSLANQKNLMILKNLERSTEKVV